MRAPSRKSWTQKDGKLPVNPSGGLKAKGHPIGATGVSMHVMSAMQLAGQAPEGMQLKNPKIGGIFNMGGAAVANYVSILEPAQVRAMRPPRRSYNEHCRMAGGDGAGAPRMRRRC